jgi:excisionase family DNA binding protein
MSADLLNAREVAQRLGISVRTVWHWTARGILPAPFRRGRVTRWRTHDITQYLNACQRSLPPRKPA